MRLNLLQQRWHGYRAAKAKASGAQLLNVFFSDPRGFFDVVQRAEGMSTLQVGNTDAQQRVLEEVMWGPRTPPSGSLPIRELCARCIAEMELVNQKACLYPTFTVRPIDSTSLSGVFACLEEITASIAAKALPHINESTVTFTNKPNTLKIKKNNVEIAEEMQNLSFEVFMSIMNTLQHITLSVYSLHREGRFTGTTDVPLFFVGAENSFTRLLGYMSQAVGHVAKHERFSSSLETLEVLSRFCELAFLCNGSFVAVGRDVDVGRKSLLMYHFRIAIEGYKKFGDGASERVFVRTVCEQALAAQTFFRREKTPRTATHNVVGVLLSWEALSGEIDLPDDFATFALSHMLSSNGRVKTTKRCIIDRIAALSKNSYVASKEDTTFSLHSWVNLLYATGCFDELNPYTDVHSPAAVFPERSLHQDKEFMSLQLKSVGYTQFRDLFLGGMKAKNKADPDLAEAALRFLLKMNPGSCDRICEDRSYHGLLGMLAVLKPETMTVPLLEALNDVLRDFATLEKIPHHSQVKLFRIFTGWLLFSSKLNTTDTDTTTTPRPTYLATLHDIRRGISRSTPAIRPLQLKNKTRLLKLQALLRLVNMAFEIGRDGNQLSAPIDSDLKNISSVLREVIRAGQSETRLLKRILCDFAPNEVVMTARNLEYMTVLVRDEIALLFAPFSAIATEAHLAIQCPALPRTFHFLFNQLNLHLQFEKVEHKGKKRVSAAVQFTAEADLLLYTIEDAKGKQPSVGAALLSTLYPLGFHIDILPKVSLGLMMAHTSYPEDMGAFTAMFPDLYLRIFTLSGGALPHGVWSYAELYYCISQLHKWDHLQDPLFRPMINSIFVEIGGRSLYQKVVPSSACLLGIEALLESLDGSKESDAVMMGMLHVLHSTVYNIGTSRAINISIWSTLLLFLRSFCVRMERTNGAVLHFFHGVMSDITEGLVKSRYFREGHGITDLGKFYLGTSSRSYMGATHDLLKIQEAFFSENTLCVMDAEELRRWLAIGCKPHASFDSDCTELCEERHALTALELDVLHVPLERLEKGNDCSMFVPQTQLVSCNAPPLATEEVIPKDTEGSRPAVLKLF